MNAKDLQLDYFKVYRFRPQTARDLVYLRGQFDIKRFEKCELEERAWFANPVSKYDEPLFDKDAHLVYYRPKRPISQPPRVVKIENQFGESIVYLGDVMGLLVPARKIEKGLGYPEKLDHYKLYEAHAERSLDKSIKLKDQFDTAQVAVTVFQVVAFAVPVEKRHGNEVFPIQNDRAHLTLYDVSLSRLVYRAVSFEDQFGWPRICRFQSCRLAVPSVKLGWNEGH